MHSLAAVGGKKRPSGLSDSLAHDLVPPYRHLRLISVPSVFYGALGEIPKMPQIASDVQIPAYQVTRLKEGSVRAKCWLQACSVSYLIGVEWASRASGVCGLAWGVLTVLIRQQGWRG